MSGSLTIQYTIWKNCKQPQKPKDLIVTKYSGIVCKWINRLSGNILHKTEKNDCKFNFLAEWLPCSSSAVKLYIFSSIEGYEHGLDGVRVTVKRE